MLKARIWIYLKVLYPPSAFLAVRTLAYFGSITSAVSLFVFSFVIKESVDRLYSSAMRTLSFSADISVSKMSGVDHGVLRHLDNIKGIHAFPVIQRSVYSPLHEMEIYLVGLDLGRELEHRQTLPRGTSEIDLAATAFEGKSVVISSDLASRLGLGIGSEIPLNTLHGDQNFRVTGIVDIDLPSASPRDRLAFTSISAVQYFFDDTEFYDRIDIVLESLSVEEFRQAIGDTYTLASPSPGVPMFEFHRRQLFTLLFSASAVGFLVAGFIIFNLGSMSLRQRASRIGLLRALGVRGVEIITVLYIDCVIVCVTAWIFGTWIGLTIANALLPKSLNLISSISSPDGSVTAELSITCMALSGILTLLAVLLGNFLAIINSLLCSNSLTSHAKSFRSEEKSGPSIAKKLAFAGGCLVIITLFNIGQDDFSRQKFLISCCALFVGAGMLSPWIVFLACRLLLALTNKWANPIFFLSVHRLLRQPLRAGIVVICFASSLALVSALQGPLASLGKTVDDWLSLSLQFDITAQLHSLSEGTYSDKVFYDQAIQDTRQTPGVSDSYGVRVDFVSFKQKIRLLLVIDHKYFVHLARTGAMPSDPVHRSTFREMHDGSRVVLISENIANLEKIEIGDSLPLDTPLGEELFQVSRIIPDYSWPEGVFFLDADSYETLWGEKGVSYINIFMSEASTFHAVENDLREKLTGYAPIFYRPADIHDFASEFFDSWLSVASLQKYFSLFIILMSFAGYQVLAFLDQIQKSAVLYALGASQKQLALSSVFDILLLATIGIVLTPSFGFILNEGLIAKLILSETGYSVLHTYTSAEFFTSVYVGGCSALIACAVPVIFSNYMTKSQMLLRALTG